MLFPVPDHGEVSRSKEALVLTVSAVTEGEGRGKVALNPVIVTQGPTGDLEILGRWGAGKGCFF